MSLTSSYVPHLLWLYGCSFILFSGALHLQLRAVYMYARAQSVYKATVNPLCLCAYTGCLLMCPRAFAFLRVFSISPALFSHSLLCAVSLRLRPEPGWLQPMPFQLTLNPFSPFLQPAVQPLRRPTGIGSACGQASFPFYLHHASQGRSRRGVLRCVTRAELTCGCSNRCSSDTAF